MVQASRVPSITHLLVYCEEVVDRKSQTANQKGHKGVLLADAPGQVCALKSVSQQCLHLSESWLQLFPFYNIGSGIHELVIHEIFKAISR